MGIKVEWADSSELVDGIENASVEIIQGFDVPRFLLMGPRAAHYFDKTVSSRGAVFIGALGEQIPPGMQCKSDGVSIIQYCTSGGLLEVVVSKNFDPYYCEVIGTPRKELEGADW